MKKELIEELDQIPMLPEAVLKIEKIYADKESSVADMTKALSDDPLIVANILKLANSPMYGFSREIRDIGQAVSLYGKDTIRSFALNIAANECVPINVSPYGISTNGYIQKAQVQNALISNWAGKIDRSSLALLAPASFLVEIGKIIISQYIIKNSKEEEFKTALASASSVEKAEKEVCGSSSYDVGATVFFNWNFDSELVYLVRHCDEPEDASDEESKKLAMYLKVAKTAVDFNGEITKESLEEAHELIEEFELDLDRFEEAIEKIEAA